MKRIFYILLNIAFLFLINVSDIYSQDVYLFSYFKGNGEDGLHLAYSLDGRSWLNLKDDKSFLKPEVGGKLMRDPSVCRAADGTFHMVWTTGWWNNGFGYASSKDLITWSEQKYVQTMTNEPTVKNNWAPEIIYDKKKKNYIIYWSAWIPGRYPQTDSVGHILSSDPAKPKMSHRIYATTTKNFTDFSTAKLFYEPGFNVIDAVIVEKNKQYIMFVKDETLIPPQKNIRIATSKKAYGPYSKASEPITGKYWAEGPSPFFVGDTCFVYFDKYRDKKYGAIISTDFKSWKDISDEINYPKGLRHGTVFKVPKEVLDVLLKE